MADGPTSNLDQISSGQSQKEVTANAADDAESPAAFGGRQAKTCSGLTWGYYGGPYRDGSNVTQRLANGTIVLSASSTNYVEFNKTTGLVTVNTTAYTSGRMPLAKITTGASTVTSWLDDRILTFATTP
jgi:hypothetical protein